MHLFVVAAVAWVLLGCQGTVGSPPSPVDDGERPEAPSVRLDDGSVYHPLPAAMRRLSRAQIQRSVQLVFGEDIEVDLPGDIDAAPESYRSVTASSATVGRRSVEVYEEAALGVAEQVLARAERYPELSDCAASPSVVCAKKAAQSFGERLFRRPLDAEEQDRFARIVEAGGDTLEARQLGLRYTLAALLVAPSFLYAHHRGDAVAEGVRRFTDRELATRLSLFLWGSIPDDVLLRAAANGELGTPEGVETHVRRMLDDPRAEGLATRFFEEAWRVHRLDGGAKSEEVFPDWSDHVAELYRTEFDLTLRHLVMRHDEDLREIFLGDQTWANAELGELYGVEVVGEEWQQMRLPVERHGLLTSGAVMAANANPDRTSPTHRGLFILSQFLCGSTPEPPEGVDLSILDREGLTGRQIVELHLGEPTCAGCHQVFDPLGLAFERFDAIGRYRTEEQGAPIDVRVELDGRTFDGSEPLARALVEDGRLPRCIAQNLYSYAFGTRAGSDQAPLTDRLGEQFAARDWSFRELVVALAASDGFRLYRDESEGSE